MITVDIRDQNRVEQQYAHPVPEPRQSDDDVGASELILRVGRPDQETVVLNLYGVVDSVTAPRLAEMVRSRLRSEHTWLVLDLSELGFLGVAGISVLIEADLRAQCTGTKLDIVSGGNRQVERALTVTAQHHRLRAHSDLTVAQTESR